MLDVGCTTYCKIVNWTRKNNKIYITISLNLAALPGIYSTIFRKARSKIALRKLKLRAYFIEAML